MSPMYMMTVREVLVIGMPQRVETSVSSDYDNDFDADADDYDALMMMYFRSGQVGLKRRGRWVWQRMTTESRLRSTMGLMFVMVKASVMIMSDMVSTTEMALLATIIAAQQLQIWGLVAMRLRSSWELFSSTVSRAAVAVTMAANEDAAFGP
jgi:hypothetical protein